MKLLLAIFTLLVCNFTFSTLDRVRGPEEAEYQALDRVYTEAIGQTVTPFEVEDPTSSLQNGLKSPVLNKGPTV